LTLGRILSAVAAAALGVRGVMVAYRVLHGRQGAAPERDAELQGAALRLFVRAAVSCL
jgi:hypothetical protein